FSCGKEYIAEISKNIEPTVVDNAFRVDTLSVSDLKISTEEVSFIVKVHGNPMETVTLAIQVNVVQESYSMNQVRVVLRDLPPNTLCYLEVIVFLPSEINHLPVEPFSTTFATPNNRSNKDFFFQHRNFYYPLDHIQTLDQRFVFLSWGDFSE